MRPFAFFFVFAVLSPVFGADYFVDSESGSDAASGLSAALAWQSLDAVNQAALQPGDTVRFKRGGQWRGQLKPKSGDENAPITYTAYGPGSEKPRLLGSVPLDNPSDWLHEGGNLWITRPDIAQQGNEVPDFLQQTWGLSQEGRSEATLKTAPQESREYTISCEAPGAYSHDLRFYVRGFKVERGKFYQLRFKAKSDKPFTIPSIRLSEPAGPGEYGRSLGVTLGKPQIGGEWKEYAILIRCHTAHPGAQIAFSLGGALPAGARFSFVPLSLCEATVEATGIDADVGNIILDGNKAAFKRWTREDLKNQDDFWYDDKNNRVVYYSDENPAKKYKSLEAALHRYVVDHSDRQYVVFDDLDIRYGGSHGFGGWNAKHCVFRNLDISWIGGADQNQQGGEGSRVRFGNGIEFWSNAEDCLVEYCRLWEIYDAALTNQGTGKNVERNLVYRNNTIWNSEYSFEYWNRGPESLTENVVFENNVCIDAGFGWGHIQRPDKNGRHVMIYDNEAKTRNLVIRNNVFYRATDSLVRIDSDFRGGLVMEGNTYWQPDGDIVFYWLKQDNYRTGDFRRYQEEIGLDTTSTLQKPDLKQYPALPALFRAESELFPFVISFDAPDNITNISSRLDAPAGKHGFVRVENGRFVTDAGPLRFWGTNTCFEANFLDREAADRMVDRLARFGTNCVRLHHLDMRNIWGPGGATSQMTLDPGQMDKLDYYVAALKKRGIYVNLNLHVSRMLDQRDGFPPKGNRPWYDKGIDNYYRPLIEANKKYAWDLLTHVNPYTGNAYKDEPAVAMIEINNENSLLSIWGGWADGLEIIEDPFLSDLRHRWNDWLKAKYGDKAALLKAWNCRTLPLGDEILDNADFSGGYLPDGTGWSWGLNANTDAPISNEDGVLRIDVRKKGDVDWQPLLSSRGFEVKKNQVYSLEIKAKASQNTTLTATLQMGHAPWRILGFDSRMRLTEDWQTFRFMVIPVEDADGRLIFATFNEGIVYEIDSISFKPGGPIDFDAGTIPVVWRREVDLCPKEMADDFCDFLLETEAKYWGEMYRYLKDDIKVRQPVSGTQLGYGSTHAQAAMDYCDVHAYWSHPVDHMEENWYLHNRALVNSLDRNVLPQIAPKRVAGKPLTLSEYNHPFPNQYAAEGFPLLAAFGAFQDWDGIFAYSYCHSSDTEPHKVTSYFFDTCGHTVQTAHMIACQTLFNADIAAKNSITAPLSAEKEREIFLRTRSNSLFDFQGLELDTRLALTNRVAVDVSGEVKEMLPPPPIPEGQKRYFIDLGAGNYILYNMEPPGRGFASIYTGDGGVFTGFVEEGKEYPLGAGTIRFGKTNLGWATVTGTVIEKTSDGVLRLLLVVTGDMRNTDMVLKSLGDDRVTSGRPPWGRAPVICEGITAEIAVDISPTGQARMWALDESGNRRQEIPVERDGAKLKLNLKSEYKTIWYEIEVK